ncbi:MAG: FKBP-type peptidyl-prolyl cis-trans isomerase [Cyanobacteriota bacterium]|nr:FKBP-type peptidyl-prolyl cis-trans isomerase [Cyanobacteriota bacterium]
MAFASLEIVPLRTGLGSQLANGDQVQMYYEGRLTNGTLFDSNYDFVTFTPVAGRTPFSLTIGAGQVIQGWEQALPDLALGDIAELRIPANLAYSATARPGIPANSDLIFTVMPVKLNGRDLSYADLGLQTPPAPVLVSVDGSQAVGTERRSADATPTLDFEAEDGSTVSVFRNGVAVGQATENPAAPGRFQFASPGLADGTHAFSAVASFSDPATIAPLAPLTGTASRPFSLVLNTQPPAPLPGEPLPPPVAPSPDPLIGGDPAPTPGLEAPLAPIPPTPRFAPETLPSRLSEGDRLITRVRTDLPVGTQVAWQLRGRGIHADDFSQGGLRGEARVRSDGALQIRHTLAEDDMAEGVEHVRVQLLPEAGGTRRLTAVDVGRVRILDTSSEPPAALVPVGYDPTDPWATVPFSFFADPSAPI